MHSNHYERAATQTPKAHSKATINLSSRNSRNDISSENESSSAIKAKLLSRMNPSITPKHKVDKLFDRSRPQSTRSNTESNSFDRDQGLHSSKSRARPLHSESELDVTDEGGKKLYKATSERKLLENQFKQIENRIKHLKDEDQRMKTKIKETKQKTTQLIKSKERHHHDLSFNELQKSAKEADLEEKKQKAYESRMKSQENRKKVEEKCLRDKQKKVFEVKNEKLVNQSLREDLRKEEEIKNCERIWKIACQEKKVENNKLYNRIKKRNEIKKRFNERFITEQTKAEEISDKIRELEEIECQLLDTLKITQANHASAFSEMQTVYSSKVHSISPLRSNQFNR